VIQFLSNQPTILYTFTFQLSLKNLSQAFWTLDRGTRAFFVTNECVCYFFAFLMKYLFRKFRRNCRWRPRATRATPSHFLFFFNKWRMRWHCLLLKFKPRRNVDELRLPSASALTVICFRRKIDGRTQSSFIIYIGIIIIIKCGRIVSNYYPYLLY